MRACSALGHKRNVPGGRPVDPDAVRSALSGLTALQNASARDVLVAASDINRLRMIRALDESALAAGDLAYVIGRSRAATSQHLAVLRRLGAVSSTRAGNVVRYRLSDGPAARVLVAIARAFDALDGRAR